MLYRDRFGERIELTDATWLEILDRYPIVEGEKGSIEVTLQSPNLVTGDRPGSGTRHYYWKPTIGDSQHPDYLRVTVEEPPKGRLFRKHARIVDVCLTNVWHPQEEIQWPRPKPGHHII